MIATMDQLVVVGRRRNAKELLVSLQSLGVVMIDPIEGSPLGRFDLDPSDQQAKALWDDVVTKTTYLLDALSSTGKAVGRVELENRPEELLSYVSNLAEQVGRLLSERTEVKDDLDLVTGYLPLFRNLAPSLAQLESGRYLAGVAFLVAPEGLTRAATALSEELDEGVAISSLPHGKSLLATAVVHERHRGALLAALNRLGLAELRLPERYESYGVAKAVHVMEERLLAHPRRLAVLEADLQELGQHRAKLVALQQLALNQQGLYQSMRDLAGGCYSFALQGWLPSAERPRVVEALKRQFGDSLSIDTHKAEDHVHNVPVKLENSGWVKPFELLMNLFAPPRYGYFDPSWTLAVFFPLMFGAIVGDIGFGLMFLTLGSWLRRRGLAGKPSSLGPLGITIAANILPAVGTIINWAAAWTIAWGFIYGRFFGPLLERIPAGHPIFFYPGRGEEYSGIIPILVYRAEESGFNFMLLLCLAIGLLQVLSGWVIRAYCGYKRHNQQRLWEGIGMFSGLVGVVIFAAAFITSAITAPVQLAVALLLAVFVVGVARSKVALMPLELISSAGNILSFLRILAIGLASMYIAMLVVDLGFAIAGTMPIIGPLLGIAVAFAIHLVALVLKIIGYTLQPLRLQYVEFFTKFGFYEASGRPYHPFRRYGGRA